MVKTKLQLLEKERTKLADKLKTLKTGSPEFIKVWKQRLAVCFEITGIHERQESEKQFKVLKAMETYGGSFVKALAEAFYHADPINFIKLKNAFPEYWEEYSRMAKIKNGKSTKRKNL